MPKYEVGIARFYPPLGEWAYPGDVITLDQEYAEKLMNDEPGLLKPVRVTTQAHPKVAPQAKPKAARGRKPRKTR